MDPDDDNDDRPHYHDDVIDYDLHFGRIDPPIHNLHIDRPCTNDPCDLDNPVVVVALDDYRKLVAAARDRHPTNHRGATDPASRLNWCYPNCAVCRTLYPADS